MLPINCLAHSQIVLIPLAVGTPTVLYRQGSILYGSRSSYGAVYYMNP